MLVLVTDINNPTLLVAELLFLPLCGSHLNGNGEEKTSGTTLGHLSLSDQDFASEMDFITFCNLGPGV